MKSMIFKVYHIMNIYSINHFTIFNIHVDKYNSITYKGKGSILNSYDLIKRKVYNEITNVL